MATPRAGLYDLDDIAAHLRQRAEEWIPEHFPYGRRDGGDWRLANIKGDPPRKNGSCVITLKGVHAGDWIDFDGGEGGGPIDALARATGLSGRELFGYGAKLAGVSPNGGGVTPGNMSTRLQSPRKDAGREIDAIVVAAMPIIGTVAEQYLKSRSLADPAASDLVFHAGLAHREGRTSHPAMVAIVRNESGERIAIHRTWLSADGNGKANVEKPRMMLGPVAGGAVRLAEIGSDNVLGIAEGIETALSVMAACPNLPVWATLSAAGLERVVLPPEVQSVVILADHDASGTGLRAAEALAARLVAEERGVRIAMPPNEGDDFNDLLQREGQAAVKAVIGAAEERSPGPASEVGTNRPIGFAVGRTKRPQLSADDGDLARLVRHAWEVIHASNEPPWLFRSCGLPTWTVRDDDGLATAKQLTDDRLRHTLAQLADWCRHTKKDGYVPAHPPAAVVKSILATPDPSLPVLAGITTTPVFGRGGELLTEPGYHAGARLLYDPPPGFVLPAVPAKPTPSDIAAARQLLVNDLLGDFPFTGDAEKAHALSLLLTGFVRAMIDGSTPLHLIEKPTPGTGATLMVDAISMIVTGGGVSVMVEGRDDEEWRKRLTAKLRQVPSIILIDNLRRPLDAAALAAALTAPCWEDRILGLSEMTRLPIRCVWVATGNNPEFSNEMARRLIRIRLDARVDQPWRRSGFRHPSLVAWVRTNRPHLVAACLTLCRAWIAAGMPRGSASLGSFEAWSAVMGGILSVAGVSGFLANVDEMLEAADGEGAVWRAFVGQWWNQFKTAVVGTSDLYRVALASEPPLPLGEGSDRSQRTRLGKALGRMRDRVFHVGALALRINSAGVRHQAQQWQLAPEDSISEAQSSSSRHDECGGEQTGPEAQPSHACSTATDEANQSLGERGEHWERLSTPNARREVHQYAEAPERCSPSSQTSPTHEEDDHFGREGPGERSGQHPLDAGNLNAATQ
jgi:putative DNA primase/helicase